MIVAVLSYPFNILTIFSLQSDIETAYYAETTHLFIIVYNMSKREYVYLGESSTEGFEDALGQCGLCAVSEGAGQKQTGLLLNGGVLVVHHSQDVLRQVLKSGLEKRGHIKYDIIENYRN